MAIAVDVRTSGGAATGVASLAWNHTVGASLSNGFLVVGIASADIGNKAASTVQWDAAGTPVSCTILGKKNDTTPEAWAELWYLKAPSSGTKQVKVTWASSITSAVAGSGSYSGVDQTTPWNAASPQSVNGTAPTEPSLTVTTANGEWVIDCVTDNENATDTLAQGAGQTKIFNTTNAGNSAGGASDKASTGSTLAMSWSGISSTSPWAYIAGSMRPASGGGGFTPLQRRTLHDFGGHAGGRTRRAA